MAYKEPHLDSAGAKALYDALTKMNDETAPKKKTTKKSGKSTAKKTTTKKKK